MAGLPFRPDVGGPPSRLPIFVPGRVFGRRASPESVPEAPYGRVSDREGPSRVPGVEAKGLRPQGGFCAPRSIPYPKPRRRRLGPSARPEVLHAPARARAFAAFLLNNVNSSQFFFLGWAGGGGGHAPFPGAGRAGASGDEGRRALRLTVCNLKGGTGKTMSSVYLAAGLSRRGRTLAVDADPQGSLLSWSEEAAAAGTEFGFPIVALPVKDLHRRARHFIGDYEHLVVDTPPGHQAIVRSAVLAAEVVVIPVQPSLMDLDRLRPTLELLAELAEINDVSVYAVMTRVRRGTRSARETRTVLEEDMGLEVLSAEVPLREAFGMSFGLEPGPLMEYEEVLGEIAATEEVA